MTHEIGGGGGGSTFSQHFRSLTHAVLERKGFEDNFTEDEPISQSIICKVVCQTVPATPGLTNVYFIPLDLSLTEIIITYCRVYTIGSKEVARIHETQ